MLMTQTDWCVLTDDDLISLTNRGTVRKAHKELETAECRAEWTEDARGLTVQWSDGPRCHFPQHGSLHQAECSCVMMRLCRHIVRSVLDYRRRYAEQAAAAAKATADARATADTSATADASATLAPEPWSPGEVSDEQLTQSFNKSLLTKARRDFNQGILAEVLPGERPMVRFEHPRVCVRFLKRADPRYARCDQHGNNPCEHVVMAVWAARRLPPGQPGGLVSTPIQLPDATEPLAQLQQQLHELIELGISTVGKVWRDRLTRLEQVCRKNSLLWLAELITELLHEYDCYTQTDARFDPERVAAITGELLARIAAIRRNNGALPELLVRGVSVAKQTLAQTQLVGLGCTLTAGRSEWLARVYLYDLKGRSLAVLQQNFNRDQPSRTFEAIGQSKPAGSPYSLAELSCHQIALASATITEAGWLRLKQANHSHTRVGRYLPDYRWEQLPEPLRQDDFAELIRELTLHPPASLRARQAGADFRVCAVAGCEQVHFDQAQQQLLAVLRDQANKQAMLVVPYYAAGHTSFEWTLHSLLHRAEQLRFVSGRVRLSAGRLCITPACLLFEQDGQRTALLPWIESAPTNSQVKLTPALAASEPLASPTAPHPLTTFLADLQSLLGELLLLGVQRVDAAGRQRLHQLHQHGQALGLAHLLQPIAQLDESLKLARLGNRAATEQAVARLAHLLLVATLAHDIANT
jgi:hypothetical protein